MTGWLASWMASALLVTGSVFMLLAALGVARLPDLFTRMQAATKAGSVGAGCILAAVALHAGSPKVAAQAVFIGLLVLTTTPIAAHLVARAAHRTGTSPWLRPDPRAARRVPGAPKVRPILARWLTRSAAGGDRTRPPDGGRR